MDAIDFGVCRLAIVPVRKVPASTGEQITQLLFGDSYEVQTMTEDKLWIQINILQDQTGGWIDIHQHHSITREYLEQIRFADFKISLDIVTAILYRKNPLHIVMGSIVPISSTELFKMEEQLAFNGESKSLSQRRDFEFIRTIAMRYVNSPFLAGGKSPFGIDSGALTQMIFRISGYPIARFVDQQALQGKGVDAEQRKPGDLAFFSDGEGRIIHAGIVINDDRIIHAYGRVRVDHLNEEGILNPETKIYSHSLHSVRRLLLES